MGQIPDCDPFNSRCTAPSPTPSPSPSPILARFLGSTPADDLQLLNSLDAINKDIDVNIDIEVNIDIPSKAIKSGESYMSSIVGHVLSTFQSQQTTPRPLSNPSSTVLPSPNPTQRFSHSPSPMDEPKIFVRSEQSMQQKVSADGSQEGSFISSALNWLGNPFGFLPNIGLLRGAQALPLEQRWGVGAIEPIPTVQASLLENRTACVAPENIPSPMMKQNQAIYSEPNVPAYSLVPVQAVEPEPQVIPEVEMVCRPGLLEETTPFVHCNQPHSDTFVFLKQSDSTALSTHINDRESSPIEGDTYDLSSCKAIDFYGNPAIQCEGDQTVLVDVLTPSRNSTVNFFNGVNDTLTLAPVVIHLAKEGCNWLMGNSTKEGKSLESEKTIEATDAQFRISRLEKQLLYIKKLLSTKEDNPKLDGLRCVLDDYLDDLAELKGKAIAVSSFNNIEEGINDLHLSVKQALEPVAEKVKDTAEKRLVQLEVMAEIIKQLRATTNARNRSDLPQILIFYQKKIADWKKRVKEFRWADIMALWEDIWKLQGLCAYQNSDPGKNCRVSQMKCGFFSANAPLCGRIGPSGSPQGVDRDQIAKRGGYEEVGLYSQRASNRRNDKIGQRAMLMKF